MLDLAFKQEQKQQLNAALIYSLKVLEMNAFTLENRIQEELNENCVLEAEGMERATHRGPASLNEALYQSTELDLHHYLKQQIHYHKSEEGVIDYLIDSLDSRGYLSVDILTLLENQFELSKDEAQQLLIRFQQIEPKGIGARNLKECLLLQMESLDSLQAKLLLHYEHDLITKNYQKIAQKEQVSVAEVKRALEATSLLQPYPLGNLAMKEPIYIQEDAVVSQQEGKIKVQLNQSSQLTLTISKEYQKLSKDAPDKQTRQYLQEKIKEARKLIHSINKRNNTLLEVILWVVMQQQDYLFNQGNLRVLTMKEAAQNLDYSASTLTRVISNKWILVDHRYYSLRALFNSNRGNKTIRSKEEIAQKINALRQKEGFSDRQIQQILKQEGIELSRRSINRYRNERTKV